MILPNLLFALFLLSPTWAEVDLSCAERFDVLQTDSEKFQSFLKKIQKEELPQSGYKFPRKVSSLTIAEWKDLLTRKNLFQGVNPSVILTDPTGAKIAIAKPVRSALEGSGLTGIRWEMEKGGLGKREVLAHVLDRKFFKFDQIPETHFGLDENGRIYSVQKFLSDYSPFSIRRMEKVPIQEVQKKFIFDIVTGGYDRHTENFLIGPKGKLALIDNGGMFTKPKIVPGAQNLEQWQNGVNPLAFEEVDENLKKQVLNLRFEDLEKILHDFLIPPKAIQNAKERLHTLQQGLRDGHSMEELIRRGKVQPAFFSSYVTRELFVIGASLVGGTGAFIVYMDPPKTDPSTSISSEEKRDRNKRKEQRPSLR